MNVDLWYSGDISLIMYEWLPLAIYNYLSDTFWEGGIDLACGSLISVLSWTRSRVDNNGPSIIFYGRNRVLFTKRLGRQEHMYNLHKRLNASHHRDIAVHIKNDCRALVENHNRLSTSRDKPEKTFPITVSLLLTRLGFNSSMDKQSHAW